MKENNEKSCDLHSRFTFAPTPLDEPMLVIFEKRLLNDHFDCDLEMTLCPAIEATFSAFWWTPNMTLFARRSLVVELKLKLSWSKFEEGCWSGWAFDFTYDLRRWTLVWKFELKSRVGVVGVKVCWLRSKLIEFVEVPRFWQVQG